MADWVVRVFHLSDHRRMVAYDVETNRQVDICRVFINGNFADVAFSEHSTIRIALPTDLDEWQEAAEAGPEPPPSDDSPPRPPESEPAS